MTIKVPLDRDKILAFCRRWNIVEFSLFGSVLRDDFNAESDVDVLVTFAPDTQRTLLDHIELEDELSSIVGRKVEVINRKVIEKSENWIRRKAILESAEPFYVAG